MKPWAKVILIGVTIIAATCGAYVIYRQRKKGKREEASDPSRIIQIGTVATQGVPQRPVTSPSAVSNSMHLSSTMDITQRKQQLSSYSTLPQ